MSEDFYVKLPSFKDFNRLGDAGHYRRLPSDWNVVICDIRGSTKAIEEGRYQDVNTLGAASIAALGEIWPTDEMPFVFGGDGASILVPSSRLNEVKKALLKLRNFARANYDMEMRVGIVPMSEVDAANLPIEVAKFTVASTKTIAMMRGGGLSWAEGKIKGDPDRYCITDDQSGTLGELQGLSCRWQPLKSKKGQVLSLLVRSLENDDAVFGDILAELDKIVGGNITLANPVSPATMTYKTFWQMLKADWRQIGKFFRMKTINRAVSILMSTWAFKWGMPAPFPAKEYVAQIPSHSDYRKFDDMLRMVIDCTPVQVARISSYLEKLRASSKIHYGTHLSDHALMTCLVGNLSEGGHIHFIDGGDGGYAMAAKSLKEQMASDLKMAT